MLPGGTLRGQVTRGGAFTRVFVRYINEPPMRSYRLELKKTPDYLEWWCAKCGESGYDLRVTKLSRFEQMFGQWANRVDNQNPNYPSPNPKYASPYKSHDEFKKDYDAANPCHNPADMTACNSAIHQLIVRLEQTPGNGLTITYTDGG